MKSLLFMRTFVLTCLLTTGTALGDTAGIGTAIAADDCSKALALVDEALAQNAGDAEVLLLQAYCRSKAGHYTDASESLDRAIKATPPPKRDPKIAEMASRWRMLGIIQDATDASQAGDPAQGVRLIQAYLARGGRRCPTVLGRLAIFQEAGGQRSAAASTARQAIVARCRDDVPEPAETALNHVVIGAAALAAKQYPSATAAAKRAISIAPADSKAAELAYEILLAVEDAKTGPRRTPPTVYLRYGAGSAPVSGAAAPPQATPPSPKSSPPAPTGPSTFRCRLHCSSGGVLAPRGPVVLETMERAISESSAASAVYGRMGNGACTSRFGRSSSEVLEVVCSKER